jgi:hypothetical protein
VFQSLIIPIVGRFCHARTVGKIHIPMDAPTDTLTTHVYKGDPGKFSYSLITLANLSIINNFIIFLNKLSDT